MLACGKALPLSDADFGAVLAAVAPDVLVDARMHKHGTPDSLLGLAPFAVGVGPGFVAGANADVVIESEWGERLGEVIREGAARAYSGEPRASSAAVAGSAMSTRRSRARSRRRSPSAAPWSRARRWRESALRVSVRRRFPASCAG